MNLTPLIELSRGGTLECVHFGAVALANRHGKLLAHAGDAHWLTFSRSTLKALQSLPFMQAQGPTQFGFASEQIAMLCASHNGEDSHVAQTQGMLEKAGLTTKALRCGCHVPGIFEATGTAPPVGAVYDERHNNCSGKHSGMLAACLALGLPTQGYATLEHPLQKQILEIMQHILETDDIGVAVDGCGVPCYRVPLHRAALGFAHLAASDSLPSHQSGLEIAANTMQTHPYLIAGRDRIDTALMQAVPSAVSKIGAEALIGVGVHSSSHGPLGIALKIEDGSERARDVAIHRILEELGVIGADELLSYRAAPILGVAGNAVGAIQPAFDLIWA